MKKILITGANSFVGVSLQGWLQSYPDDYLIDTIDMRDDKWKETNFSKYDTVFHVAGIAHVSYKSRNESLYFRINRDLAVETAELASKAGVSQFIFMSSIIVYGDSFSNSRAITKDTIPNPNNSYGCSKLKAEIGIQALGSDTFKIVILRPPMIYGKGAKGNYPKLSKLARTLPVFPDYDNQRSMLYIDNLCEFIRLIIENEEQGVFFPQNSEYVKTSELVKLISENYNKRILFLKIFNPIISLMIRCNTTINKLFGNFVYEKNISVYKENYQLYDLKDSIHITENNQ